MSKIFSIWKRKFKDDKGNQVEKYYACPKTWKLVDQNQLAEEICQRSSLTEGDVLGVISALSGLMLEKLLQGESVKIKGIGTFGIWVTSEGFDDPKDINPKKVKATKVTFKADRKLTKAIKEMKFDNMPKPPKGLVTKEDLGQE